MRSMKKRCLVNSHAVCYPVLTDLVQICKCMLYAAISGGLAVAFRSYRRETSHSHSRNSHVVERDGRRWTQLRTWFLDAAQPVFEALASWGRACVGMQDNCQYASLSSQHRGVRRKCLESLFMPHSNSTMSRVLKDRFFRLFFAGNHAYVIINVCWRFHLHRNVEN